MYDRPPPHVFGDTALTSPFGAGTTTVSARYGSRQCLRSRSHPVEGGSANDYDYVNGDPVNGLDLAGLCNEATESCVIGILRGSETLPDGFADWLSRRSGGQARVLVAGTDAGRRALRSNGSCSSPIGDTGRSFNFRNACRTHDLGYDLIRFFGTSGQWGSLRAAVDDLFGGDMLAHCSRRSAFLQGSCGSWAGVYLGFVTGNSIRQFYRVP